MRFLKKWCKASLVGIIDYAIDETDSFNSIDEWIRQCKTSCSPETKFFLIGNKVDVDADQ